MVYFSIITTVMRLMSLLIHYVKASILKLYLQIELFRRSQPIRPLDDIVERQRWKKTVEQNKLISFLCINILGVLVHQVAHFHRAPELVQIQRLSLDLNHLAITMTALNCKKGVRKWARALGLFLPSMTCALFKAHRLYFITLCLGNQKTMT